MNFNCAVDTTPHLYCQIIITKCLPAKKLFDSISLNNIAADNDPILYLLYPTHRQMIVCATLPCTII